MRDYNRVNKLVVYIHDFFQPNKLHGCFSFLDEESERSQNDKVGEKRKRTEGDTEGGRGSLSVDFPNTRIEITPSNPDTGQPRDDNDALHTRYVLFTF